MQTEKINQLLRIGYIPKESYLLGKTISVQGRRVSKILKEPLFINRLAGPHDELKKLSCEYFKQGVNGRSKSKPVAGVPLQKINVMQLVRNKREARK